MENKAKKHSTGHQQQKAVCFSDEVPNTPIRPVHSRVSLRSSVTSFLNPHDITEARDAISSHKLYISNLPHDTTFGDLQNLFPKALTIVLECRTKETKTATVEFDTWKSRDDAFKKQKNSKLRGKLLIIAPKTSSLD